MAKKKGRKKRRAVQLDLQTGWKLKRLAKANGRTIVEQVRAMVEGATSVR